MLKTKILIIAFLSLCVSSGFLLYFSESEKKYPAPKEIEENEDMKERRKEWWEKKHRAAEGVDWKAMDERTRKEKAERKNMERKELLKNGKLKSNEKILESFGNGALTGEWNERGSENIAGRMHTCDIDFETNTVYGGSSGGVLWKGTMNGQDWQPLNDFMSNEIIFTRQLEMQIGKRLTMAGGKYFYYSDNDGLTWETAEGFDTLQEWGNIVRVIVTNTEPAVIFALTLQWDYGVAWDAQTGLYRSDDLGETFTPVTTFAGWDDKADIWTDRYGASGTVYMINETSFYKLDNTGQPAYIADIGNSTGRVVLTGIEDADSIAHLSLYSDDEIYRSDDSGLNWIHTGDAPDGIWGRNSFRCSLDDPERLYIGSTNLAISTNAGANWTDRNDWSDYYGQPVYMLHADIDGIDLFRDTLGNEVIMVSTDGGLFKSFDELSMVENITRHGIRTGQFYSTYTNRTNTNFIYMGSQDQGFQKCRHDSGGVLGFNQSISGDYGSICSGNNGQSLWTVYPGFAMYYPDAADLGDFAAFWDFPSDYGWQWMAPTMPDPYDYNYAFTGGSDSVVNGQYLWYLQYISGSIEAERLPYNFSINNTNEITAIASSPIDWNYRYVLTNKGRFFYSDDEGQSWTLSSFNQGNLRGNVIIPSPTQLGKVIIAGSGYSNPGVYISENHGQNFTALNSGIPQTSFNDLKLSSTELLLFAATDVGPYCYNFNTQEWFDIAGISTPDQNYTCVDFIPSLNTMRFGTYGRGTWDFVIDQEPLVSVEENKKKIAMNIFPNPFSETAVVSFNLEQGSTVLVDVYDLKGQKVFSENRGTVAPGEQRVRIDRDGLESGVYLVSITAGERKFSGKIVVQ